MINSLKSIILLVAVNLFFLSSLKADTNLEFSEIVNRLSSSNLESLDKHANDLMLFMDSNPDFNINRTQKKFDEFHSSLAAENFSSFILLKRLNSHFNYKSQDFKQLVARLYPQANPIVFKLNKIDQIESLISSCSEGEGFFCVLDIVLSEKDSSYLNQLFINYLEKFRISNFKSFDDHIVYSLLKSFYVDKGFCNEYFSSIEQDAYIPDSKEILPNSVKKVSRLVDLVPYCKNSIISVLYTRARYFITSKKPVEVLNSLFLIRHIDQSEKNFTEIKKFLFESAKPPLRSVIREYFSFPLLKELTFSDKLCIILFGYLPTKFYFILFLIIFLTPILFIFFYKLIDFVLHGGIFSSNNNSDKFSNTLPQGKKAISRVESNVSNKIDEYSSLLMIFDLPDDAEDDDIKKAYREMIKKLHPDSGTEVNQEKLDEIKKAYDRLIELRKGWFGSSR
jgi:hypothetical protein